jgi:hypothetical protein
VKVSEKGPREGKIFTRLVSIGLRRPEIWGCSVENQGSGYFINRITNKSPGGGYCPPIVWFHSRGLSYAYAYNSRITAVNYCITVVNGS